MAYLESKPRYEILDGLRVGFWWCSLSLIAIFAIPAVGGNYGVADVILSVGLAWGLLKLYGTPVRKWLTENWLKRGK